MRKCVSIREIFSSYSFVISPYCWAVVLLFGKQKTASQSVQSTMRRKKFAKKSCWRVKSPKLMCRQKCDKEDNQCQVGSSIACFFQNFCLRFQGSRTLCQNFFSFPYQPWHGQFGRCTVCSSLNRTDGSLDFLEKSRATPALQNLCCSAIGAGETLGFRIDLKLCRTIGVGEVEYGHFFSRHRLTCSQ